MTEILPSIIIGQGMYHQGHLSVRRKNEIQKRTATLASESPSDMDLPLAVLYFIDSCTLCRGQNDERFLSYILSRKGRIMDHTGIL